MVESESARAANLAVQSLGFCAQAFKLQRKPQGKATGESSLSPDQIFWHWNHSVFHPAYPCCPHRSIHNDRSSPHPRAAQRSDFRASCQRPPGTAALFAEGRADDGDAEAIWPSSHSHPLTHTPAPFGRIGCHQQVRLFASQQPTFSSTIN